MNGRNGSLFEWLEFRFQHLPSADELMSVSIVANRDRWMCSLRGMLSKQIQMGNVNTELGPRSIVIEHKNDERKEKRICATPGSVYRFARLLAHFVFHCSRLVGNLFAWLSCVCALCRSSHSCHCYALYGRWMRAKWIRSIQTQSLRCVRVSYHPLASPIIVLRHQKWFHIGSIGCDHSKSSDRSNHERPTCGDYAKFPIGNDHEHTQHDIISNYSAY